MKRFSCPLPECTSSYQRKEHLHRHLAQHRGTEISACPFCDRVFGRRDTMQRHVRQDHETDCSSRAKQACRQCRMAKTRCKGTNPCHRCSQKGLRCYGSPTTMGSRRPSASPDDRSSMINDDAHIQQNIESYFKHFHPQWPFLHPGTFSAQDEPPLLLYSVMLIGLWHRGKPSCQASALALHDKIGKTIWQQRTEWDSTAADHQRQQHAGPVSLCPIATFQGILLYLIFALVRVPQCSATGTEIPPKLSTLDHDILIALVRACRRRSLFFYPTMLQRYRDVDSMACIWVGVEEIKRLGVTLCRLCRLCRGDFEESESDLLNLSELQFPVPDSKYLWEAESNSVFASRLAEGGRGAKQDSSREENWISNHEDLLSGTDFGFD